MVNKMKRFVVGDIHGNVEALKHVLYESKFNYSKDLLVILGDVSDGHYYTREVVDVLLMIKNKVFVRGNHDQWTMNWFRCGDEPPIWTEQGGMATIASYRNGIPIEHIEFFKSSVFYRIIDNILFVHGGLDQSDSPQFVENDILMWDRNMISRARKQKIGSWDKIFVGHTTTELYGETKPIKLNNVWMMDTGAGCNGVLTIMNIDSEEYWQW